MTSSSMRPLSYPEMNLQIPDGVYEPAEDTFMVLERCSHYSLSTALDLGTGCGIVAITLSRAGCPRVVATDISLPALMAATTNTSRLAPRVHLVLCDLFDGINALFDLVVFNPPYLPVEPEDGENLAWAGGTPAGRRLTDRFLAQLPDHLADGGRSLLIQSSLNGLEMTETEAAKTGLRATVLEERSFFFEKLYLIELSR